MRLFFIMGSLRPGDSWMVTVSVSSSIQAAATLVLSIVAIYQRRWLNEATVTSNGNWFVDDVRGVKTSRRREADKYSCPRFWSMMVTTGVWVELISIPHEAGAQGRNQRQVHKTCRDNSVEHIVVVNNTKPLPKMVTVMSVDGRGVAETAAWAAETGDDAQLWDKGLKLKRSCNNGLEREVCLLPWSTNFRRKALSSGFQGRVSVYESDMLFRWGQLGSSRVAKVPIYLFLWSVWISTTV